MLARRVAVLLEPHQLVLAHSVAADRQSVLAEHSDQPCTVLHLWRMLTHKNVLQLSLCLIKKPATVIYAVKAHALVVVSVMLGGVVLLLYKVISGGDFVLQVGIVGIILMHGQAASECTDTWRQLACVMYATVSPSKLSS